MFMQVIPQWIVTVHSNDVLRDDLKLTVSDGDLDSVCRTLRQSSLDAYSVEAYSLSQQVPDLRGIIDTTDHNAGNAS